MILEGPIYQAENARGELTKAVRSADRWSDNLRQQFDAQRLTPLNEAGRRLIAALKKAAEQGAKAERLLAHQ